MNDLFERINESQVLIARLKEDYQYLPDADARCLTRKLWEYEEENRDNLLKLMDKDGKV